MSEQERYGQEPYEPQEPYAPYAPGYPPQGQHPQGYDPYAGQQGQQGYDPSAYYQDQGGHYGQGQGDQAYGQPPPAGQYPPDQYPQQPYGGPGYDEHQQYHQPQQYQPYGQPPQYQDPAAYQAPQAPQAPGAPHVPHQRVAEPPAADPVQPPVHPDAEPGPPGEGDEEGLHTEQFAFVEEEDEQAEDVIDWLKFSESRSERRDERKRRGRARTIALIVVLALALVGGVGYLWRSGMLPGLGAGGPGAVAAGAQKRDVIVVHLREVDSTESSTALMVRNETTGSGTTVLLPNSISVSGDNGSTTLGKSVVDDGSDPTRDSLDTLLGADIQGTWRLDTPYLEILVDAVGGITLNADATVVAGGKTVVTAGRDRDLNGSAAVAYATHRGPGETQDKQLARFGQVMQALLTKLPGDTATATKIVDSMGAIPDPSLSDGQLGATLGALADLAKTGHYTTTTLPVQADGTLSEQATSSVVKDVLGGAVKNTDASGIPTIAVRDASGDPKAASGAQVQVVNAGYTYVSGGTVQRRTTSQVLYATVAARKTAEAVAKTLGLPVTEVVKGTGAANADVTVVLGGDYRPPAAR